MSLQPALSVTIGNLRYDTHAVHCNAILGLLPRGSSADIRLPGHVRFEASPGDDAILNIDGGEGSNAILTGRVRSVRRTLDQIRVTVADAAADLAALRPSETFEKQGGAQIIKKLASDANVTAGNVSLDLDLPSYVAHPGRTASEHVAELARMGGAIARTDSEGSLNVAARPSGQPSSALKFGREIITCEVRKQKVVNGQRFAIGFGPAGSGSAPNALRHSTAALPGSAPDGGPDVRRHPTPAIRVPGAATSASTALQTGAAARTETLVATCFLLSGLRVGEVIEIQDLPDGLSEGPWLLTRVEHRFRPGGASSTKLEAETAGASALIGSLIGAIGGLL
jgi:hypothetical protein